MNFLVYHRATKLASDVPIIQADVAVKLINNLNTFRFRNVMQ